MAKHLFVMDPMDALNRPLDTSLRTAAALARAGDTCYHVEQAGLSWDRDEGAARARCSRLNLDQGAAEATTYDGFQDLNLSEFASIHMRKDPPFDMRYISTTWLLESASQTARLYNHPTALRSLNEKLAIFHFPEATAAALVSSDPIALLDFTLGKANGDAIIKPLDLFGGRGVERIQASNDDRDQALKSLRAATGDGQDLRLIQPFDHAIYDGEVRVFTAFGKPVSWCLKRPEAGSFLANTRAGAVIEAYTPSPEEEDRVVGVAEALMLEGVAFIGFDLIGGLVSEINITSPRLLLAPGQDESVYDDIAAMIRDDIAQNP